LIKIPQVQLPALQLFATADQFLVFPPFLDSRGEPFVFDNGVNQIFFSIFAQSIEAGPLVALNSFLVVNNTGTSTCLGNPDGTVEVFLANTELHVVPVNTPLLYLMNALDATTAPACGYGEMIFLY
jgi:hypothetical protein